MHLLGIVTCARKKGTGLLIAPAKKRRNWKLAVLEGALTETVTNVGAKGTSKVSVGKCWRMRTRDLRDIN